MKVKDFIKMNADIDVYDDVCEELGICFCGPMGLTEAAQKYFADVLEYDIAPDLSGRDWTAVVKVDGGDGDGWKERLNKAEEFFYAAAGYCTEDEYNEWFISPEWGQYATDPDANIYVTIYCDTAWYDKDSCWYTEEEIWSENLCEMSFPRKLVQDFYVSDGGTLESFNEWIQDEYTADDTDGLFGFCKDRGFIAVKER